MKKRTVKMMKTRKKLIDAFGDVLTNGGIFSALNNYNVPWKESIDNTALDVEYFYNISGQKYTSPLVGRVLGSNDTLTPSDVNSLANVIFNMFGRNWLEQYATLNYEYNPISNYDMIETETINGETSDTTTHTGTVGTVASESATGSGSGSSENDVFGFNSVTATGDTSSSSSTSNTNTASGTNTRTDNLTDANEGTKEETRTLTRSGNIGVTTSQQMIESQRQLWLWNFFYNVVFPDINKVLTIATYSNL